MEAENAHKKPVNPGEDGLSMPLFTPDSGFKATQVEQLANLAVGNLTFAVGLDD